MVGAVSEDVQRDEETSTWFLGDWDRQIIQLLLAWRKPTIFRPMFKIEIAKRVNDPLASQLRSRAPSKGGIVRKGETNLNHRVANVVAHLQHGGLVSRTVDTIKIIDRAGIEAILAAGQVTYPRRGNNEDH